MYFCAPVALLFFSEAVRRLPGFLDAWRLSINKRNWRSWSAEFATGGAKFRNDSGGSAEYAKGVLVLALAFATATANDVLIMAIALLLKSHPFSFSTACHNLDT